MTKILRDDRDYENGCVYTFAKTFDGISNKLLNTNSTETREVTVSESESPVTSEEQARCSVAVGRHWRASPDSGTGRETPGEAEPGWIAGGEGCDARRGFALECRSCGDAQPCGPALDERELAGAGEGPSPQDGGVTAQAPGTGRAAAGRAERTTSGRRNGKANRVSSYFTPARVESADQTQGEEMALTKEDLLSSLRTFKTKLREELTTDIRATLEAFQMDVNGKLAALQTDVYSVGARTLDLETHKQNLQQKVAPVETELANVKV
ncbi:hypothetical protein NDU88_005175 [Pleurodeles waltl]|uniref:Uncharacterized protein n=1 Tax=Pleurodeles waltl TaxID=8319 RepID=A0AAV7RKA1_PLEWA|nr:hypothetical protein NDU88_005175 [Pleurodeles waltl]